MINYFLISRVGKTLKLSPSAVSTLSLTTDAATLTVPQTGSATMSILTSRTNYTENVTLSILSLTSSLSASFDPLILTSTISSSILTITDISSSNISALPVVILASGSQLTASASIDVTVTNPSARGIPNKATAVKGTDFTEFNTTADLYNEMAQGESNAAKLKLFCGTTNSGSVSLQSGTIFGGNSMRYEVNNFQASPAQFQMYFAAYPGMPSVNRSGSVSSSFTNGASYVETSYSPGYTTFGNLNGFAGAQGAGTCAISFDGSGYTASFSATQSFASGTGIKLATASTGTITATSHTDTLYSYNLVTTGSGVEFIVTKFNASTPDTVSARIWRPILVNNPSGYSSAYGYKQQAMAYNNATGRTGMEWAGTNSTHTIGWNGSNISDLPSGGGTDTINYNGEPRPWNTGGTGGIWVTQSIVCWYTEMRTVDSDTVRFRHWTWLKGSTPTVLPQMDITASVASGVLPRFDRIAIGENMNQVVGYRLIPSGGYFEWHSIYIWDLDYDTNPVNLL